MPKTLDQLKAFAQRLFPGNGPRSAKAIAKVSTLIGEEAAKALYRRPTLEDVFNGWRFILGRDPNDEMIKSFMRLPTVAAVRRDLIRSAEFKGLFTLEHLQAREHPDLERGRPAVVYIHLLKTGGTSLRAAMDAHFADDRICPMHFNELHNLPVAELGHYDFFKGHFDYASIRFIPRDNIRVFSVFRDPRARLLSMWRSLKASPVGDEYVRDSITMVNRLTIEEYFEHPEIRSLADVHNYYLMTFGFSPSWIGRRLPPSLSRADREAAMDAAKRNIRQLTAIGITERFEQSTALICKALGVPVPGPIAALNVTDDKPNHDPRFRKVEAVTITPRLQDALAELIEFDDELYRFAVTEFERRCALEGIN